MSCKLVYILPILAPTYENCAFVQKRIQTGTGRRDGMRVNLSGVQGDETYYPVFNVCLILNHNLT